jgi:hypothetical protein
LALIDERISLPRIVVLGSARIFGQSLSSALITLDCLRFLHHRSKVRERAADCFQVGGSAFALETVPAWRPLPRVRLPRAVEGDSGDLPVTVHSAFSGIKGRATGQSKGGDVRRVAVPQGLAHDERLD